MYGKARSGFRRVAARLWLLTLVGIVLGAVVGLLLSMSAGRSASATALIRIQPVTGLDQILTGATQSSDAAQAYLADQLAYLSSVGYRLAVKQSVPGVSAVDLTATQEGQSSVVRLSATAADPSLAGKIVNSAVDVYRRQAEASTQQRVTAAMGALDRAMEKTRADAVSQAGGQEAAVDPAIVNAQLEPLRNQRVALEVALQLGAEVDVINPTYSAGVEGAVSPALGIVGGGLVGGVLALAGGLWWRVRSGLIVSADALERQTTPVLRPVVRLKPKAGRLTADEATLGRALYAQLPSPGAGRTIVVGASTSSGAEAVARLLHYASSEHGSVAAANVDEFAGRSSGELRQAMEALDAKSADTTSTIVVGSSFATAPALTELLPSAARVVFVVLIGVDTEAQVEAMCRSLAGIDVPTATVATVAPMFGSVDSDGARERASSLADGDESPP